MKALALVIAMAGGFAIQNEGSIAERLAWNLVQVSQILG